MKVAVLGTRGFPNVQGGVERHCQNLYPRLAKMGCQITVFTRKPYVDPKIKVYDGVNLVALDCPKSKHLEAITHTLKGIFAAKKLEPDLLHFHTIGPSFLIPLARLLGFNVVMTTQGPDYRRKKWGIFAKLALKLGERLGSYFANEIICVSKPIADDIKRKYKRDSYVIPNGIEIPEIPSSDTILKEHSLEKFKYILTVGRYVPEKGFMDLINAFNISNLKGWKLVIVGGADHESSYSKDLKEKAKNSKNIILTGLLTGKALQEIYSYAGLFVLPSYHEGLPLVLLEAMSYGLLCLASDIEANRNIPLPDENYFAPADIGQLCEKLKVFIQKPLAQEQKSQQIEMLRREYDWNEIARKTMKVYNRVVEGA